MLWNDHDNRISTTTMKDIQEPVHIWMYISTVHMGPLNIHWRISRQRPNFPSHLHTYLWPTERDVSVCEWMREYYHPWEYPVLFLLNDQLVLYWTATGVKKISTLRGWLRSPVSKIQIMDLWHFLGVSALLWRKRKTWQVWERTGTKILKHSIMLSLLVKGEEK